MPSESSAHSGNHVTAVPSAAAGITAQARPQRQLLMLCPRMRDSTRDFTADDVVFTAAYAADPAAAMTTVSTYRDVKVVKVDSHTVRVEFAKATPFWAEPLAETLRGQGWRVTLLLPMQGAPPQPKVLEFAPLSGHCATLLRDTVTTLLPDHDRLFRL